MHTRTVTRVTQDWHGPGHEYPYDPQKLPPLKEIEWQAAGTTQNTRGWMVSLPQIKQDRSLPPLTQEDPVHVISLSFLTAAKVPHWKNSFPETP